MSLAVAPRQVGPLDARLGETKKLLQEVVQHFHDSRDYLAGFYPKWERFYKLYRGYAPPKSRPWRANVFVPIPFAQVEHGLATLMEAWFASQPFIKVFPREGTDYEGARVVEMYLAYEADQIPAYLPIHSSTKEMLMYGTGWSKVYWDWQQDRNTIEAVSVWNIFPDPSAEGVDDAEYIIHRSLRSAAYLRRMARLGIYDLTDDEIEQLAKEGLSYEEQGETLPALVGSTSRLFRNRVEILEEWQDDRVVTLVNRKKVVRAHRNHFPHGLKPFIRWVDHPVPHEILGIGELEVIEKLCEEINDIRNQRLDVVSLAINNVLVASRSAGIDPESLVMRPGGVIWADDPRNAVVPLVQGGNPALGVQEEGMARFDLQEATGNWGYNQGQTPNRREAATTVLALQRASGMRFTAKVRWNEEAAVKRLARMMIANAQAFMPPERWVRVTGQPLPMLVRREEIQGDFDYVPAASSAEPREVKRAQVAQILPLLMQNPQVDQRQLLDWLLDLYGVKEKEKFILSDEAMMERQMMLAAATAQGRQQGQVAGLATLIGNPQAGPPPEQVEEIAQQEMPRPEPLLQEFLGR